MMENINHQEQFWKLVKSFKFESLENKSLNDDEIKFLDGLQLFTASESKKAINVLKELYMNSECTKVKENASKLLFQLLYSLGDWKEIKNLGLDNLEEIELSYRRFAKKYCNLTDRTYSFSSESCILPLSFSITGAPTVEVKLNGVKKLFWVDTGAITSVLSSETASICNLKEEYSEIIEVTASTSQKIETKVGVMNELIVGNFAIKLQPAVIIDTEHLTLKNPATSEVVKIDGIIGWDMLQLMDIELNYDKKYIKINKPIKKSIGINEKNIFFDAYLIVKIFTDDNKPLYFGVDTGAAHTSVSENFFEKVNISEVRTKKSIVGGVGGFVEVEKKIVDEFSFKIVNYSFSLKNIVSTTLQPCAFFELDGIIGSDLIQNRSMRIDFENGLLEIDKG
jgi:hypothetical protein